MSHTDTPDGTTSEEHVPQADVLNPFGSPETTPSDSDDQAQQSGAAAESAEEKNDQHGSTPEDRASEDGDAESAEPVSDSDSLLFQAPDLSAMAPVRRPRSAEPSAATSEPADSPNQGSDAARRGSRQHSDERAAESSQGQDSGESGEQGSQDSPTSAAADEESSEGQRRSRRKRRRGGRGRSRQAQEADGASSDDASSKTSREQPSSARSADGAEASEEPNGSEPSEDGEVVRRRRRRRRGSVDMEVTGGEGDDPEHTVTRVRAPREAAESTASNKVTGVKGSTRLEAKRQRRRSSRDSGRRRQVITEAEFLARRESVDRKMIIRQHGERIQIGVLEDGVLAEHHVSNTTQDSLIGNVYLGKVQNVLPSMEAAFVDIGRGRNAVLYAGEVDWNAAELNGKPRKIENALKSGSPVLVQVTKDPVGHKGARLTSQVSLPGRYLVFVPGGSMTGISRKLPDTERSRLKKILKEHMPENAGVIVRTAAEGASEEELTHDINRLRALWESTQAQSKDKKVLAPELLYSEPDLTIKVVRDVFNEDFSSCAIQGEETWDSVEAYVTYVAPHLLDRLHKWSPQEQQADDIFAHHRIDEQLAKALDRKVNLPSGGSLVFDRTEAMTVVDVNTGKFTGSGGNLEETVTRNNLEAAEEFVRQLRLRDIGGIIVVDFIDMVLESNRDLVLRRLVECLGRDRTKHQVAEVTSLGLVQMTRKRMGTGLLEVFSEPCEHCAGRGLLTHSEPVGQVHAHTSQGELRSGKGSKKRRKGKGPKNQSGNDASAKNEVSEEDRQKQEKARQALAQVAAATAEQADEESAAHARTSAGSEAPQSSESPQGTSSGRGRRRGRGASAGVSSTAEGSKPAPSQPERTGRDTGAGADGPAPEQEAVVTIAGESVPVPRGRRSSPAEPSGGSAAAGLQSLDAALATRASEESGGQHAGRSAAGRGPRRRRRAAGSAQGATGQVQEISASPSEEAKTFTSSGSSAAPGAGSGAASAPAPAPEPVMFGVGVSAADITEVADGASRDTDDGEPEAQAERSAQ